MHTQPTTKVVMHTSRHSQILENNLKEIITESERQHTPWESRERAHPYCERQTTIQENLYPKLETGPSPRREVQDITQILEMMKAMYSIIISKSQISQRLCYIITNTQTD
ncbi:hypothetical protein JTB14_035337 [Gonioctena quinquepunctata]|nr:hypothetical protein JTB14_035337 [Gonioctena quinquepunctata]